VSLARSFLVVLLLLTTVVRGEAADQKPSVPQEASAPPPSRAIPLAEVASRATEAEALLRAYQAPHAFTSAISLVEEHLPEASALISLELERTLSLLPEHPPLATLEAMQEVWERKGGSS